MSLAMEKKQTKDEITGAIRILKSTGATDNDIIAEIMETFHVTKDYVRTLLSLQKA